eukprot:gene4087-4639_t
MEEKTLPNSFHIAAEEECETSDPKRGNSGLLEELRSVQNDNFSRLEGVLTGSLLGLQKTLSELIIPLATLSKSSLKRPCPESDAASESQGPSIKATKASASGCSKYNPSAIATGNNADLANRTSVATISKNAASHTLSRPEDPLEPELDYNENSGEYSDDDISIPEQDSLDADVQALLTDQTKVNVEDNDSLLTQIQGDLLIEADTTDAVNEKLAGIMLGLWGQKLAPEKLKSRLNKFLKPQNCDIFVPKCNKDIWSDKIDTMARQFDLAMQKVQNMILHSTFGIIAISDKALQLKSQESSEIASMSIDLVAILTNAMHEINQMRRDNMKPKLGTLAKLANDVSPNAPLLFGSEEDLSKRISKITATNTAMAKSSKGKFSKNFKTPPYHSRYRMRGQRGGRSKGRPNRRPFRRQNYNGQN